MHAIRRVLNVVLLCSCLCTKAYSGSIEEVNLAYFVLEPHISKNYENDMAQGLVVEFLSEYVGPEMQIHFSFTHIPLARAIYEAENNKIAGVAIIGFTQKRAENLLYSALPIVAMRSALAVRTDSPIKEITAPSQLNDIRLGYVLDAIKTPFAQNIVPSWNYVSGKEPGASNIKMLLQQRLDAVYSPSLNNLVYTIDKMNVSQQVRIIPLPEPEHPLFIAFSPENQGLKKRFDEAFVKIEGAQVYSELVTKFIKNQSQTTR